MQYFWVLPIGDDKYKEIKTKLPRLAAVVSGLLSAEGLKVDGVKYTLKVTFGGKMGYVVYQCVLFVD
jgi:hypothetical protein